ncbi:MAG: AhpC/TSA family protein [Candidatus Heimdallarchaeota archaeon]|nr:AhpC/TSA family protein [Candidatus Heimdallarchaeota archaeon]
MVPVKIREGRKAQSFTVIDLKGNSISLDDYRNKKVLLSFYRYASCPLCNLRISQIIQQYNLLKEKGLHIIAFFQSPRESMEQYVGKQNPPFPLIPDPERKIYKLYDVERSWVKYLKGGISRKMAIAMKSGFKLGKIEGQKNLVPADFLLDNLVVKKVYYGTSIADHIPFEEIFLFLER